MFRAHSHRCFPVSSDIRNCPHVASRRNDAHRGANRSLSAPHDGRGKGADREPRKGRAWPRQREPAGRAPHRRVSELHDARGGEHGVRKYKLGLVLAHQHLHQLVPDVRHAVLANVGTLVVFRLGPEDAPIMSRELSPVFEPEDLLHLPSHNIAVKLMIDGAVSKPFSATSLIRATSKADVEWTT